MEENDFKRILDEVETQMLQLSDSVAQLRVVIDRLSEENNKLRMSNMEIRERFIEETNLFAEANQEAGPDTSQASGRASLQGFYDEGIHVCHEFFGSRRDPDNQCLFCQEVINRLIDNAV